MIDPNDYFVLHMGKGTVNELWVPVSALLSPQSLHAWVWGEELSDRPFDPIFQTLTKTIPRRLDRLALLALWGNLHPRLTLSR